MVTTMSSPPPGIVELQAYRTAQLGRGLNLGIVGDSNHKAGYHLGPDRTPVGDYSERLARDKAGARLFPYYASAEDSSMAWSQSRQWLAKLVTDARNGVAYTRDIREIIGSLDGQTALYWDAQNGFQAVRYLGSGHLTHTHISFFRDSAQRDQSDVLRMYLEPPTEEDDMALVPIKLHGMKVGERRVFTLAWGDCQLVLNAEGGQGRVRVVYMADDGTGWHPLFGDSWSNPVHREKTIKATQSGADNHWKLAPKISKISIELLEMGPEEGSKDPFDPDKFSLDGMVQYFKV